MYHTESFMNGLIVAFTAAALIPPAARAWSGGPPDMRTGAPGEGTCVACHSSFPLNGGDGSLQIVGPPAYEPGETYGMTVILEDPGQMRWGFELTSLEYGQLVPVDGFTQPSMSGGRMYVKQTGAGTFFGTPDGPVSWDFLWQAPPDPPEALTFYAAGNAANGNGGASGDYIYTSSFTSQLAPPPPVEDLEIQTDESFVLLSWSLVAGASSYAVYRSTEAWSEFVLVGETGDTAWSELLAGDRRFYQVRSVR